MFTVSLHKIRFSAPIGLYPQEHILYNNIEVDISVSVDCKLEELPFIDYTILYTRVKKVLTEPADLLETILQKIVAGIQTDYPGSKTKVAIRKLNPPMDGEIGSSEVMWES